MTRVHPAICRGLAAALLVLSSTAAAQLPESADPHRDLPAGVRCESCHGGHSAGGFLASAHDGFLCTLCHDPHGQTANLHNVRELIDTPNSGALPVVLLNESGPDSYADGDAVYDGVCEVCHTQTDHHRNNPSGDHAHFAAFDCTQCHDHWNGYLAPPHPEAITDCSNCHGDPATGQPDLLGTHDANCSLCHPVDFTSTILGPLGTWTGECNECHTPSVPETGPLDEPTKGHRCVVCHGQQLDTSNVTEIHQNHAARVNCVVCHGFVPDVGTEIGSGNRDVCAVCHVGGKNEGIQQFHERHAPFGVSCLECHGDVRPPVDVVAGPPVGNAAHVCAVCHSGQDPSDWNDSESLHERHTGERVGCGHCHAQAELQDDRLPMPPIDDVVRMQVPRAGFNECTHCHDNETGSSTFVHRQHAAEQWQWCYNCHEGTDLRPVGLAGPVTAPAEACVLCHTDETYDDPFPFGVHFLHAKDSSDGRQQVKCHACHQATPPIEGWPASWSISTLLGGGAFDSR